MIKGNLINASAEILLLSKIVMNISLKQTYQDKKESKAKRLFGYVILSMNFFAFF
jgi:hypothetical protein